MYEVDFTALPKLLNKWIINLRNDRNRYIICKGGGGSGKSYGIIQLNVYRCINEPGHKYLVVRKVGKTIRESIFALIQEVISSYDCMPLFKVNKTDMTIECINGNKFIFTGIDDVEKLKSIQGITDIIIEEGSEIEIGDYRQLDIRLRGKSKYPKQMFIMFNPINVNHWLKKEFFDTRKANATIIETTYKDNRFLDAQAKKVLEDFKESDPYYYMVYCLNEWGVVGKTIFDAQKVSERLAALRDKQPIKVGMFTYEYTNQMIDDNSIQWIDDVDGYIKIYDDVKPGYPYVVGGDTSGDGSDSFIGQVLNNVTGEQVCTLKHQFDEDLYTKQMYCLGKYFNNALIGIESNFSTYPIMELTRLGYYHQYNRESVDSYTGVLEKKYGFKTTSSTRPVIIAALVQVVREEVNLFNDIDTLEEMLTFVRNEKGKATAQLGSHDDCIMSVAIAHHIRNQQTFDIDRKVTKKKSTLWMFNTQEKEEDYVSW